MVGARQLTDDRTQSKPRRERGSGRVYFDASKQRWVAAVTYEGKVTKRLFKIKPEAASAVKQLVAKAERRELARTNQTLDELLAEWLVGHIRVYRAARTFQAYKGKLDKHVSPRLGKRKAASMVPKDLRALNAAMREEGTWSRHKVPQRRPLSPTTINQAHLIPHSAFEWAVRDERLPRNPCDQVHPPQRADYEATTFDEDQIPELLAAINGHRYEHLWRFQLATGARHGEATAIREADDLDVPRMIVRLWEVIAYVPVELRTTDDPRVCWERKKTKTARSRRTTPLSLPALRAVQAAAVQAKSIREAAGADWFEPDLGLIFPDDDGRPLRESKVLKAWNKMLERNKLPKCRPHDLRHSAAELALEHGAELIDVSRLLGHANTAITDRIYAGRLSRSSRRAADRLAGAFGEDASAGAAEPASGES
jgi:integrase